MKLIPQLNKEAVIPSTTQPAGQSTPTRPAESTGAALPGTVSTLKPEYKSFLANFSASASNAVPSTDLHDLPAQAIPSLLSKLPAAVDTAIQSSVQGVSPDTFAAACAEALRTSQQPGGAKAVADYVAKIKNPDLKNALVNFVAKNSKYDQNAEVDSANNFNSALLKLAKAAYPSGNKSTTPPAATKPPVATTPSASTKPPVATTPSASTKLPIATKPSATAATPAGKSAPQLTDAQAFNEIANVSGKYPGKHNYSYDIASVLHMKVPGFNLNTNASAAQYASFAYALGALKGPGASKADGVLADWMASKLDALYPKKNGFTPMSAAMLQLTQVGGPKNKDPNALYGYIQNNVLPAFTNANYLANGVKIPNIDGGNIDPALVNLKVAS
jgi:hypothetical protein